MQHIDWTRLIHEAGTTTQLSSLRLSFRSMLLQTYPHDAIDWRLQGGEIDLSFHEAVQTWHHALMSYLISQTFFDTPASSDEGAIALLLCGSGGRNELTLWSDQDNGIVFAPDAEAHQVRALQWGEHLCARFALYGYEPCEGQVLASQPSWCRSLDGWKTVIQEAVDNPDFFILRKLLILADARVIYGDEALVSEMKMNLFSQLAKAPHVWERLLANTMRYKLLFGLMGNLLTERYGADAGALDIKYGAYLPFVSAIRLLAMRTGVQQTSTLARLQALEGRLPGVSEQQLRLWRDAFVDVLRLRWIAALDATELMNGSSGMVQAPMLTKTVRSVLRDIVRIGSDLQKTVKRIVERGDLR